MKKSIKIIVLYCAKYLGLFFLARNKYRNGLRILCYHGFSDGDKLEWLSTMFISPQSLADRMAYLKKKKYTVLPLDRALDSLSDNTLPESSVVITIDDGLHEIQENANPIFQKYGFPYTIYITSYYSLKGSPIYNLAIPYLFWKAKRDGIDIRKITFPVEGISSDNDITKISAEIIKYGHENLDNEQRVDLLKKICASLGFDYETTFGNKSFSILSVTELKELVNQGVDLQLHTHRHVWPLDETKAEEEIEINREFIESITQKKAQHLCYPSGLYSYKQFPYLKKFSVKSATTCDFGINYRETHPYRLYRFLDSSEVSQIMFEAEMSGFLEAMRSLRNTITFSNPSGREHKVSG